jgi:acyl-CoA thioesterase-1
MIRILLALALALAGVSLGVSGASAQQPIRIVAFGGSSTYGQGVERYDAYPAKLEKALRARGHNVTVTNAGVSGDKTADGLARLDRVIPAGTQIVIVEYGINDAFAKVDPATIRANLETMLGRIKGKGAEILLVGFRGTNMQPMADRYGAAYTDFNFPNNGDAQYRVANDPQMRSQGVAHFNAAGYDQVVARMLPQAELLIARLKR